MGHATDQPAPQHSPAHNPKTCRLCAIYRHPGQAAPASGGGQRMSQVTDTERTTMHTQTAAIADTLNANPGRPMTEGTLISEADRITGSTRERTYLLASLPPATEMTQGEYAAQLRRIAAPDDGSPTNDPAAVLLAETRGAQGETLTAAEHDAYERYQDAAHAHGITGEQILDYLTNTLRPAVNQ